MGFLRGFSKLGFVENYGFNQLSLTSSIQRNFLCIILTQRAAYLIFREINTAVHSSWFPTKDSIGESFCIFLWNHISGI